ncbi:MULTISPECIES: hypothetical protein [unclassified Wolbachia]|uniref:hypothetical protein n=1 Tax=unclassified Wolbachia TaxID=2640676 RepID=UPI00222F9C43|nr:hypothetical protein [Wolbachia endosymbiont (group A) of Apoderus coryli]
MNAVADDYEEVVNNSGNLGKVESTSNVTLEEEEEFFDALEEQDWLISNITQKSTDTSEGQEPLANFNVPLSIFHYKDYNSDFFTSWYNVSSRIFKEINQACPEKKVLNLALSVLMFPYIVFTALGLAVYNKLKTNDKTQISSEENKTKKVSESTTKRLAYGVLAAVAILVSIPILLLLLIPATPALATFYLLNRKLSHSLIDVLKVSSGSYQKKHQNIEVSFREIDAGKSDIKWDMEVKFPPQFKQLLRDLYEDPEHNAVLKLSANIHLKNGLVPLRDEIRSVLATSIQGFAKTMEELIKLEKKDITYDKLKELLNEFRLEVVNSVGPKLTSHLIQNAYQVAFIQAIKFAQERKGDFSEDVLRDILVKQELESQGKELPSKETAEASRKAEEMIKELERMGEERYGKIREELKEIYENRKNSGLKDDALKRKLEDLFKFEYNDQKVEQKLIESRIRKAKVVLNQSDLTIDIRQSLLDEFYNLNVNVCSHHEVNLLLEKMHSEITKCGIQGLFKEQEKSIKNIEDNTGIFNEEDEKRLVNKIVSYRKKIGECLTQPAKLKEIIEKQNKNLDVKKNSKEKESSSMELIELCLKNNQEILEALEQLELKKERLLINEKATNDYREELESREKIKFAIIEDKLLEVLKQETFNEKEIKKLFEKAELEYCLAERCIKYPVIKTKDNIKHFSQNLLSPLIDRLVENIINNVPKNDKSSLLQPVKSFWTCWGYIKTGLVVAIHGDESTEGKALDVAHTSYKEGETFLQHFESSYEKAGAFLGDLFSDEGETFKNDVWPKIEEHLHGMWDRFFKDVEFTLVKSRLDEVSLAQQGSVQQSGKIR